MLFSIEKLLLKEYIAPPFYAAELLSNKLFLIIFETKLLYKFEKNIAPPLFEKQSTN
jgi:hypothetical protein